MRGRGDRREPWLRAEMLVDEADGAGDAREVAAVEKGAGMGVHGSKGYGRTLQPRPDSCAQSCSRHRPVTRFGYTHAAVSATGAASGPRRRRCRPRPPAVALA